MKPCGTDGVMNGYDTILAMLWIPALAITYAVTPVLSPVCPACFASYARTVATQSAIRFGRLRERGKENVSKCSAAGSVALWVKWLQVAGHGR